MRYINLPLSRQFLVGVILQAATLLLFVFVVYRGTLWITRANTENMIAEQSAAVYNFLEEKSKDDIASLLQVIESNPYAVKLPPSVSYIEWESFNEFKGPIIRTSNDSFIKPAIIEAFKEKIKNYGQEALARGIVEYTCDNECFLLTYSSYQVNQIAGNAYVALNMRSITELLQKHNNHPTLMIYGIPESDSQEWLDRDVAGLNWEYLLEQNKASDIWQHIPSYKEVLKGKITYRSFLDAICEVHGYGSYVLSPFAYGGKFIGFTVTFMPKVPLLRALKMGLLHNITAGAVLAALLVLIICHYIFNQIRLEGFFLRNRQMLAAYADSPKAGSSDEVNALLGHLKSSLDSNESQSRQIELLHSKLKFYSGYDPLSGLPNRQWIQERLSGLLAESRVNGAMTLFAAEFRPDLPPEIFEDENGARRVAAAMRGALGEDDCLAVLEPSVYCLVTAEASSRQELAGMLNRVRKALAEEVNEGKEVRVCAGIVQILGGSVKPSVIMKQTHAAYERSLGLKSDESYVTYTDEMSGDSYFVDEDFAKSLREAGLRGDITLRYDQVVDVNTGAARYLIARCLWFRDGETVNLDECAGQLTGSGLNTQNACWKIEYSLQDLAELDQNTSLNVGLMIPLNAGQFLDANLLSFLDAMTAKHRIQPGRITFALTENALSSDIENCLKAIGELKTAGYHIALQDYTPGMIDMTFIRKYGFSAVLLSGSLTAGVLASDYDRFILTAKVAKWLQSIEPLVMLQDVSNRVILETFRETGVSLMCGALFPRGQDISAVKASINGDDGQ